MKTFIKACFIALAFASPALAQVEPPVAPGWFPLNNVRDEGGGIYPVASGPGVVMGNEVKGQVTFDLDWHFGYNSGVLKDDDQSMTVIYTIDDKPASPRKKAPYTWTWDSTTVPDGSHSVGVIIVDGIPNGMRPTGGYVPSGMVLTVDNIPGPVTAPQKLASIGTGVIRYWQRTSHPEWIDWPTGYTLPHPTSTVPYAAPVAPTAASLHLPDDGLGLEFIREPLTRANVSLEASEPKMARSKTGHIFVDNYMVEKTNNADASLPGVLAEPLMDGARNDNGVSPYSTYIPWGRGFWGIDIGGRMFSVALDGSVKTVAGRRINRAIVPYSANDPTITEADRNAIGQIETVGTFDTPWTQPNDLAADPRDHHIVYVADTEGHRITKTVFTSDFSNSSTATYAGGFVGPSSVIAAGDGTLYVSDYDTGIISKIAPDNGANITPIATGLNQPFGIRFDSHGNIIIVELIDGVLKRLDLATNTVSLILNPHYNFGWIWLDVDRTGSIGPVDYIYTTAQFQEYYGTRISPDGSSVTRSPMQFGHYPWAVAISPNEGRIYLHGFGDTAPSTWRVPLPDDPTPTTDWLTGYTQNQVWPILNRLGTFVTTWGTVPEFPISAHPSQAAIRGGQGFAPLPGYQSDDDVALGTPAQIGTFINNGLGGGSPRPEIVGWDLSLASQQIQQLSFRYPNPLHPMLPTFQMTTPPVISDVVVSTIDATTAQVAWKTDKPTLGYVRFGTAAPPAYFRWSDVEAGFGTTHAVTLPYLPDNATEHFMVVVVDQATVTPTTSQVPNFVGTPDHTFQTGTTPPPVPTATLTASPTSVQVGQASGLTWASTNATGCVGTGFTAGAPSGVAIVSPPVTTSYGVACTGPGGTSPVANAKVTVTAPPPPVFPAIGSAMKLTVPVGVYATPSETGKKLCTQSKGATGTVMGGPSGTIWLQINYTSGCDGWSIYQTMTPP